MMNTIEQELIALEKLKKIDTPTVANVVSVFPGVKEICLGLYHPAKGKWFSDPTLKPMFPELGPQVGYALTCTYGDTDGAFSALSMGDLIRAIGECPLPVVVVAKQDMPEEKKKLNGLLGGNMMTAFQAAGAIAAITDGPSRDIHEVRPLGMQYMLTGVVAGHIPYTLQAIGAPVEICGMMVATGDIIHMDENGAVKFPRSELCRVVELSEKLLQIEAREQRLCRKYAGDPEMIAKIVDHQYDGE